MSLAHSFHLFKMSDLSIETQRRSESVITCVVTCVLTWWLHMVVTMVMVGVQDKGEMVMRAYTPTSCDDDVGYFDLVVKVYFANNNPAFPLVSHLLRQAPPLHASDLIPSQPKHAQLT